MSWEHITKYHGEVTFIINLKNQKSIVYNANINECENVDDKYHLHISLEENKDIVLREILKKDMPQILKDIDYNCMGQFSNHIVMSKEDISFIEGFVITYMPYDVLYKKIYNVWGSLNINLSKTPTVTFNELDYSLFIIDNMA